MPSFLPPKLSANFAAWADRSCGFSVIAFTPVSEYLKNSRYRCVACCAIAGVQARCKQDVFNAMQNTILLFSGYSIVRNEV
jgi:hypothetical protein